MNVPTDQQVETELQEAYKQLSFTPSEAGLYRAVTALLKAVVMLQQQRLAERQRWFP